MTLINLYFKIPEVLRFTIITLLNIIISYMVFVFLVINLFYRDYLYLSLIIMAVIQISLLYVTMKYLVFAIKSTNYVQEIFKTALLYISNIVISALIFIILQKIFMDKNIVGLVSIVGVSLYMYIILKKFIFK